MATLRPVAPRAIPPETGLLFDDRLATVLRHAAQSEPGARTQYRQLLDLLGSMPPGAASELVVAAYERLGELSDALPQSVQPAILRAPGRSRGSGSTRCRS